MKAILKEQLVFDELLSTVMAEAVNNLNSRPLIHNSDSPLDEQPLTPNHLFHLRPIPGLSPGIFVMGQCWFLGSRSMTVVFLGSSTCCKLSERLGYIVLTFQLVRHKMGDFFFLSWPRAEYTVCWSVFALVQSIHEVGRL